VLVSTKSPQTDVVENQPDETAENVATEIVHTVKDIDSNDEPITKRFAGSVAKRIKDKKKGKVVEAARKSSNTPKKVVVASSVRPAKNWTKVKFPTVKKKSLKRKKAPPSDTDTNAKDDVLDIVSSDRKRAGGKKMVVNVSAKPLDNISFHSKESIHRWKFVYQRRIGHERELGKDALKCKENLELLEEVGLMKTVFGLGS
jgi:hypothetical protein